LLLASEGQTLAEAASVVKRQWGASLRTIDVDATAKLESELVDASGESETGRRWVKLARCLASGEYEAALRLLMEQNAFVMKVRAGAGPWLDLNKRLLRVRLRDDDVANLPDKGELPTFWRHSYFIDSLRTVAVALRG
jgi:hypothetical protein